VNITMRSVTIIDSGLSNLDSVVRAIEYCGGEPTVTNDPQIVAKANRLILPGVGAFPIAMKRLNAAGITEAIQTVVLHSERPMLGICLGMQLMATIGHEHESCLGLNLIKGDVIALDSTEPTDRIPHIGWNTVNDLVNCPLLKGIPSGSDFYFAHSFCFQPRDHTDMQASTPSFGNFAAIVSNGLVFGTQFHPEKSQAVGFMLVKNFLQM
jgi:imidazole glycerol-phosphate synthase subunit HisH